MAYTARKESHASIGGESILSIVMSEMDTATLQLAKGQLSVIHTVANLL